MSCAACGHENPAGGKFCLECGSPLARACPSCGAAAGAAKFCGECGTPLTDTPVAPAPAPMEQSERRVCSVLFVDLVGFTPFTEARDAEDVREMLSRYFDRARTIVERYGGVVEKFIGDAVMAIWGTPVAVEGDAERAVRAGLELLDSVAELGAEVGAADLRARAGVVTGDVAITVGLIGEGIAGDTVNTAARVQSVAEPGTVWVDDVTERVTHAAIGYRDCGEHALKGKAEPLHLWAATRVLSTVSGVQRVDGLEAPLLGRDVEWRTMKDLLHATVDRRAARLVLVSGPAGVGKSRLGWEFEKYIDGLATMTAWHRGRCLSYGDGVAFWALAEVVRQRFGIAEEDSAAVGADKLIARLPEFVPDPGERDYVGARLAQLLGVPWPGGGSALPREELFAGWRLFFERLAAQDPVILLLEDLHHADSGLLDFLDHLVDWSREAPIFVLGLARPEFAERGAGWGVGRNRTTITLDPLAPAVMEQLVDTLVPGMPVAARTAIVGQAQGVPLYAVETIRSLIDRDVVVPRDGVYRLVGDVSGLSVPDTLRGLLAARYDALPRELHTLLADAAVLGSNFPAEALVAVSGRETGDVRRVLDELVRREILDVSADPLSPQRGFYGFSQNLLRQVVYETLSRRDRKARHLAVAAHLRATFAGDGDEVVEAIAQHYVDALSAVPDDADADDVRAEAVAALARAAERARRAGAPGRAAGHLQQAAELVEGDDREAGRFAENAAEDAALAGDSLFAIQLARRAVASYEAAGLPRAAARAEIRIGREQHRGGELDDGLAILVSAAERLRTPADNDTVRALCVLSKTHALLGHGDAAIEVAAEAMSLAQAVGVSRRQLSDAFGTQGLAYLFASRAEEAAAALEHAIYLAELVQDTVGLISHLGNYSDMLLCSDAEAAAGAARRAVELAVRLGDFSSLGTATANLADALLWLGRWDEAEQALDQRAAQGLEQDVGVLQSRAMLLALRGDLTGLATLPELPGTDAEDPQDALYAAAIEVMAAAAAGDEARTIRVARAALTRGAAELSVRAEATVWCLTLGLRAARRSGDRAAEDAFLQLYDTHPEGHWPQVVRAACALVRAERTGGDPADAVGLLRAVASPFHLAHGLLDHAAWLRAGDPAAAQARVDEAAAINEQLHAATLTRRLAALDAVAAS